MKLEFKANDNFQTPDLESKRLSQFLVENKIFVGFTLSLLDSRKNPVAPDFIEDYIIKTSLRYDEIEGRDKYTEFVDIIKNVYDTDKSTLDSRRGYILELLWDSVGTINSKSYNKKIENSHVIYEGEFISSRDIDIAYLDIDINKGKYNFIELHECKASIKHKVDPPQGHSISDDDKEKLELMKDTGKIANEEHIDCGLYIITYDFNDRRTKNILKNMGFEMIDIITRRKIEHYISDK